MMANYYQSGDILKQYYRFHSLFYDSTRWSFLFGRKKIIDLYKNLQINPDSILEVGCGTGKNLLLLIDLFPNAHITGLDISSDMLKKSQEKLQSSQVVLREGFYESGTFPYQSFDLILFSYSLSMMNPGWESVINHAYHHLTADGHIAVVDFFDSNLTLFKKWMGVNHVRMEGHLSTELERHFDILVKQIDKAYFGVWDYLLYIGRKRL